MHVIAGLTLLPLGAGNSLSAYIAACQQELAAAGVTHELHATGTNIEGEWEAVTAAVKRCHERLHGMGVVRIHTQLTLSTRGDRDQSMAERVASVAAKRA